MKIYSPTIIGTLDVDGNSTLTGSLNVTAGITGSLLGTASFADNATTASYALVAATSSYINLSNVNQDVVITGSLRGEVTALSISSQTASLDCSANNFFTLQLVAGVDTRINPSNISPGQTINLRVNTTGSGTVSFPTSVKQISGSSYVPTTTTGVDIVTFISFDSTNLYLANVKNLV